MQATQTNGTQAVAIAREQPALRDDLVGVVCVVL